MVKRLVRTGAVILALVWLSWGLPTRANGSGEVWVLVDTSRAVLEVLQGGQVKASFPDIAIGRYGATKAKHRGDNRTPLGSYHVAWMEPRSRFHYFIGLDYPTPAQAERGAELGIIGAAERRAIDRAFQHGRVPPQTPIVMPPAIAPTFMILINVPNRNSLLLVRARI